MQLPRPVHRLASIAVAALFSVILAAANAQPSPRESQSAPQKQSATHDKQSAAHQAAPQDDQTASLAKAVQNPVASLISVPLQNNTNFDIGPNNRTQNILSSTG